MTAMTLAKAAKLPRRINTDADLAQATEVAADMASELWELRGRQRDMETKYPALLDPGLDVVAGGSDEGGDEEGLPAGVQAAYDKLIYRISNMRQSLQIWSATSAQVVVKQIEARHKSGELVTVGSVQRYLNGTQIMLKKYVDPRLKQQAEREMRTLFQQFIQENPAALLEVGAQVREQQGDFNDQ